MMKYAFFLKKKLLLFEGEIRKSSPKRNSYFEFIAITLCIIIKSYQHTNIHTENLKMNLGKKIFL